MAPASASFGVSLHVSLHLRIVGDGLHVTGESSDTAGNAQPYTLHQRRQGRRG